MTDWRVFYDARDWTALDNWWRWEEDRAAVTEFRDRLKADVQKVTYQNGTESQEDIIDPSDASPEWKGAVEILLLGELDAYLDGDPEPVPVEWHMAEIEIRKALESYIASEEVTEGDDRLSRRSHAGMALGALAAIDAATAMMADEIDPDHSDPESRTWLLECFAEIAARGYEAGYHAKAADSKEHEAAALKTYRMIETNRTNGLRGGQADKKQERYRVLDDLAKQHPGALDLLSDTRRVNVVRQWAVEYDAENTEKLFLQKGEFLSKTWFANWVSDFLSNQEFKRIRSAP